MPPFGLLFEVNGITVFHTTDTQFAPEQIKEFYKRADVIFHDCETTPFESGVHANYQKLKTCPPRTAPRCGSTTTTPVTCPTPGPTGSAAS